jgi:hypothetical protein
MYINEANWTPFVVPCGRSKNWERPPGCGPTAAAEVYTGTPFRLNRQYAERIGDA